MKFLKSNLVFAFLVSTLVVISLISINYIFASNPKTEEINGKLLSQDELDKLMNSPAALKLSKELEQKKNQNLENTWNEIKRIYNINENEYVRLLLADLFSNDLEKNIDIFSDSNFKNTTMEKYSDFSSESKKGDLMPSILVKKDKTQIIFLYKDKDDNKIIVKYEKNKDNWVKNKNLKKE